MFRIVLLLTPLIFLISIAQASSIDDDAELDKEWQIYRVEYGKSYEKGEEEKRKRHFGKKFKLIKKHNRKYEKGEVPYRMGINHLSDWSEDEHRQLNTLRVDNSTAHHHHHHQQHHHHHHPKRIARHHHHCDDDHDYYHHHCHHHHDHYYHHDHHHHKHHHHHHHHHQENKHSEYSSDLPSYVNWREEGYVTSVKNQGKCGACYAFGGIGALEASYKKVSGKLVDLSEQNIIDCTSSYGNDGCNGGTINSVFQYATTNGVESYFDYPYTSFTGNASTCNYQRSLAIAFDYGYINMPAKDETVLQNVVAFEGPVAVGISASSPEFASYEFGIFNGPCNGSIDHAVLIVGYGTDPIYGDYWIIKNSWGTSWGMEGYMLLARNQNMCGVSDVSFMPFQLNQGD